MDEDPYSYQYSPIHAETEIRVLMLEPGTSSEALVARLLPRKIQDDPENPGVNYACVSYCWGRNEDFRWLKCDEGHLRITAVVDTMLRHLRKPTKARNLWIDAICINQTNDREKEKQVVAMGSIYSMADKVHVWLGPAMNTDRIPFVFSVLKATAITARNHHAQLREVSQMMSEEAAVLISSLLSRAWFTRRWVLQEVALGHAVTLHCGHQKLAWDFFQESVKYLHFIYSQETTLYVIPFSTHIIQALENISSLQDTERNRATTLGNNDNRPKQYMALLQLLWIYHTTQCIDERDRVFSLYGLLPNNWENISRHLIHVYCPVDYSSDFAHTYQVIAKNSINGGYTEEILEHVVAFGALSQQDVKWPSWVPSWNKPRKSQHKFFKYAYAPLKQPRVRRAGRLDLCGSTYEVVSTQNSAKRQDLMHFFKSLVQKPCMNSDSRHTDFNGQLVLITLRAIGYAERLYHNTQLDINEIICEGQEALTAGQNRLELFHRILRHELFGTRRMNLEYDSLRFSAEISRLLHGQEAFCYKVGREIWPGIALQDLQLGDYVFRPDKKSRKCTEGALVIRPYSSGDDDSEDNFRLLGACFDSLIAYEEPLILSYAEGTSVFPDPHDVSLITLI